MAKTASPAQREEGLIRRIQRGDDAAFDRLVELCTPRVYNLAFRLVGQAEDAQDIAQEAFLRVYHALPRFKGDSAFSTWLYRIVVNVCQDEIKRRRRRPASFSELEAGEGQDGPSFLEMATTGETAEDTVTQRERTEIIQQAITRLPEAFRLVLVLYDIQGFSYQEIAEVLHMNVGTVKSRLNRARNLLREQLSPARELLGLGDGQR